jgi:hypothetical protein
MTFNSQKRRWFETTTAARLHMEKYRRSAGLNLGERDWIAPIVDRAPTSSNASANVY